MCALLRRERERRELDNREQTMFPFVLNVTDEKIFSLLGKRKEKGREMPDSFQECWQISLTTPFITSFLLWRESQKERRAATRKLAILCDRPIASTFFFLLPSHLPCLRRRRHKFPGLQREEKNKNMGFKQKFSSLFRAHCNSWEVYPCIPRLKLSIALGFERKNRNFGRISQVLPFMLRVFAHGARKKGLWFNVGNFVRKNLLGHSSGGEIRNF